MSINYENLLTPGLLERMKNGESVESLPKLPVLQMIGVKCVAANPNNPASVNRYRLIVSDGISTHSFVMLATTLNSMFESGEISENCIFEVKNFVPSKVSRGEANDRNVLILFSVKVLHKGSDVGGVLKAADEGFRPASAALKENVNGNASIASTSTKPQTYQEKPAIKPSEFHDDPSEHLTMPIDSLSPYQNKWVIKARVTAKSPIRTWNNAKGEGKLFSFDLCDETGEIRVTAFRDSVDKYFDIIEIDKVYYISKCQIKPANKQYSKLKNDYEMTVGSETLIQLCVTGTESIPKIRYDLISIAEISEKQPESVIDVIGICQEAGEATKLIAKATGRELTKRDITLVDSSNSSIALTLWGNDALSFENRNNPTILLKSVMVKEYGGGKTLGMISSTVMTINPQTPEGHKIRGWYEREGSNSNYNALSTRNVLGGGIGTEWLTFHDTKVKQLGNGDKPDYFQLVGMVHNIRQTNMIYKACSVPECNKKVVDNGDGTYRCEKCNIDGTTFKNRLLVNVLVGDWTSNRWITLFADVAEQVLGKNGDEIAALLEGEKSIADAYLSDRQFRPMMFKLRTKVETFGDVPRPKTTAVSIAPIPYKEYNAMLLKNIFRLSGIKKA